MPRTTRATERQPGGRPLRIRRKNLNIDQEKLDRAVTILGAKSETEAIDQALDMILFRDEIIEGIERLAELGPIENYFDEHPDW